MSQKIKSINVFPKLPQILTNFQQSVKCRRLCHFVIVFKKKKEITKHNIKSWYNITELWIRLRSANLLLPQIWIIFQQSVKQAFIPFCWLFSENQKKSKNIMKELLKCHRKFDYQSINVVPKLPQILTKFQQSVKCRRLCHFVCCFQKEKRNPQT